MILWKHLVPAGQYNIHTQTLRPSGLAFWKKGKYVAEAGIKYFNHSHVILRWIWKVQWKTLRYSCKPKKPHQTRTRQRPLGRIPLLGSMSWRQKKHSDTEEVEQSGRALDWKGRTKQRDTVGTDNLFLPQSKGNLFGDFLVFQAKYAYCTLCLLLSLIYACFQLNCMLI